MKRKSFRAKVAMNQAIMRREKRRGNAVCAFPGCTLAPNGWGRWCTDHNDIERRAALRAPP
jgi:hypothetical protein